MMSRPLREWEVVSHNHQEHPRLDVCWIQAVFILRKYLKDLRGWNEISSGNTEFQGPADDRPAGTSNGIQRSLDQRCSTLWVSVATVYFTSLLWQSLRRTTKIHSREQRDSLQKEGKVPGEGCLESKAE